MALYYTRPLRDSVTPSFTKLSLPRPHQQIVTRTFSHISGFSKTLPPTVLLNVTQSALIVNYVVFAARVAFNESTFEGSIY